MLNHNRKFSNTL